MTPKSRRRLYMLGLGMAGVGAAVGLTLFALGDNLSYFRTPTELVTGNYPEHEKGRGIRLGGLVEKGSLQRAWMQSGGENLTFRVTDLKQSVTVRYRGIVPDLFREGQGVVAEGKMDADGTFRAERILAKHDEKYEPPEVKNALHPDAKR